MVNWNRPFSAQFRVAVVDRVSGNETAVLNNVKVGGVIERNLDTKIKESAQVEFSDNVTFGSSRVRLYAHVTFADGEQTSVVLGTFVPNVPKWHIGDGLQVKKLDLYGLLQELEDDMFEQPITIKKGSFAVDEAARICSESGVTVAPYNRGSYQLKDTWTFGMYGSNSEQNGSKLDAVNALLELAGFQSARTDELGRVLLLPYSETSERSVSYTFSSENAQFLDNVDIERDMGDVANVVKVVYWSTDKEFTGIAVDDNPKSELSTVSRGRRVVRAYTFSNIPDKMSDDAIRKLAHDKAVELLNGSQAVVHRVKFVHMLAPVTLGDDVSFQWREFGISGAYRVRVQHITLDAGIPVECEARRFERRSTK